MGLTTRETFNGDETLDKLMKEICEHLQGIEPRRFSVWKTKPNPDQVRDLHRSWTEINIELSLFVREPEGRYKVLMSCIESHQKKFASNPAYAEKLRKLAEFLAKGPTFSEDYDCQIKTFPVKRKR